MAHLRIVPPPPPETPGSLLFEINQIFYQLEPWQRQYMHQMAKEMLAAKNSKPANFLDSDCPF